MKAKTILSVFALFSLAGAAFGRDETSAFNVSTTPKAQTQWNTDPKYWDPVLREPKEFPDLKLGKSDYMISGPLIDGLRRSRRSAPELSLGKRILRLPIVRLFVPAPMPAPPGRRTIFFVG